MYVNLVSLLKSVVVLLLPFFFFFTSFGVYLHRHSEAISADEPISMLSLQETSEAKKCKQTHWAVPRSGSDRAHLTSSELGPGSDSCKKDFPAENVAVIRRD